MEVDALEFERAVKVQACPAGDLHAIATDCALHVSTADTEGASFEDFVHFLLFK